MIRTAIISADGLFRYSLKRIWGDGANVWCFVMCNPSTADAVNDDPTIRRCIAFAKAAGADGVEVVNLLSRRGTKPKELTPPYRGDDHDYHLFKALYYASVIVCAWGTMSKLSAEA